jgi:hypothetical protein
MKPKYLLPFALLAVFCASTVAQTVTITSKKTVYRRPRPMMDFKKSFTVTRPIAKASTPALSRKITTAISPDTVLGLNVKEEISDIQWLEETDFETLFNKDGVLSMKLWMTGTGAYPDSLTRYVIIDLKTGNRINIANTFTNLSGLASTIKKAQKVEVDTAIKEIKSDPENKDADPEQLFENTDFKAADLKEFSVSDKGVTFYYDYGFPHVIQALEPAGEFPLTWAELKPFIKPGGLLARFVR